ncbi:MAG: TonB-dependent receptor plug domain-containing protein [Cytophagales bacterium]|nr:TonB-dependent receptor plug domain-containing protein [Cytophagales bacterium]
MNLKTVFLLIGILLSNFYVLVAQNKTAKDSSSTHHLQEVEVQGIGTSNPFVTTRQVEVDSLWVKLLPQSSITDLLSRQSAVFMKEYGVGGLSSPVIRGATGGQTAVLWNGINIQSPMSASVDFSLIPVSAADNIAVQYGGSSAQQGTSAIGGAIIMNSVPRFSSGLTATGRAYAGSFGRWGQQYEVSYGSAKLYSSTKFFQQEAINNFPYKNVNEPGQPIVHQINNQIYQKGIIQELTWKLDSSQSINARIWYQTNERNLPPTMGITNSRQEQQDRALRTLLDWSKKYKNLTFLAKGAFLNQFLGYQDPDVKVSSVNYSQTYIAQGFSQLTLGNHIIGLGGEGTFNRSNTNNYGGISPKQDRLAGLLNYSMSAFRQRFLGVANLRLEFFNGKAIPLLYSLKGTYAITKEFSASLSSSRNYRLPSLNDLYWAPGGNLNLVPEDAWMQELAFNYTVCQQRFWYKLELVGFTSIINHAIVWLPGNSGIWNPVNVNKTWARGIELAAKAGGGIGKISISGHAQYHYTLSTIESSANKNEIGKQLIYTPIHRGVIGLTIAWKGISANYTQSLTGLRYSTSDNSDWTEGYTLGSALVSYQISIKHFQGNIYAQVNNILR